MEHMIDVYQAINHYTALNLTKVKRSIVLFDD